MSVCNYVIRIKAGNDIMSKQEYGEINLHSGIISKCNNTIFLIPKHTYICLYIQKMGYVPAPKNPTTERITNNSDRPNRDEQNRR